MDWQTLVLSLNKGRLNLYWDLYQWPDTRRFRSALCSWAFDFILCVIDEEVALTNNEAAKLLRI